MNTFLKAMCIVIYVTAVIGALGVLHAGFMSIAQQVAFRSVQRHTGPLIDSIGLTLLFGFLHWWPLNKRT